MTHHTSIHHFFTAREAPIPPGTPPLPLALQIAYLHYPICRWYFRGRLSKTPLILHTALLATPLIQDQDFILYEIPDEIRLVYPTVLYPCGRRIVQRVNLLTYLAERATTCHFDVALIMDTDDLIVLLQNTDTPDFLVMNGMTGSLHHAVTLEECMNHVPDKAMNIVIICIHSGPRRFPIAPAT